MTAAPETPEPLTPSAEPVPPRRGHWIFTLLAWLLIVAVAGLVIYRQAHRPAPEPAAEGEPPSMIVMQMLGRYLVGAANLTGTRDPSLLAQVQQFNTGPPEQRWRFITLTGELGGPGTALEQLTELDHTMQRHEIVLNPTQRSVRAALGRLYQDYSHDDWRATSLTPADRQLLETQLGWFGELALNPAAGPDPARRDAVLRPAYRTLFVVVALVVAVIGLGLLGVVGLFVFIVLWGLGFIRGRLGAATAHGGVYAETFALWIILFLALSVVGAKLSHDEGLLLSGAATLLSLVALVWPVIRGIPWRQVRQDIGWTLGPTPIVEPAAGVACYAVGIPLVLIGLGIMLLLLRLQHGPGPAGPPQDNFSSEPLPSHPIIHFLARPDWWMKLQLVLLASVIAPIVEETMFRGVLYRHLRDATHRLGSTVSALLSATVVSFLFAAIHPQGLVAVPVLMAIAYALTLAREWRGTLLPGMVAHGLNNGVVLGLFLLAAGD